ncbi:hydantoinase/oxoprolinase family protein [Brevibacillus nitrificans]|uniref:Hydantoinase/oxoprolinase family protein n=1 Tax=Brevibacillus nitrificans TaxID=651560 RepID=A0A3M8D4L7_9BACL|nr:hydantoinase/oxoprolinase family protein [Brevibacillus nitrificans]RNB83044.1 hydantoinase/oxoprolinase family protein [Brevibacillus nitrificans]
MKRYRLSVDIGGTFTDLVLFDKADGVYHTTKILTTTDNLARGVLEGVSKFVSDFSQIDYFVHGTTSGLNAFLERRGAGVALLVTEGFKDIYELGRGNRLDMYNIKYRKTEPLLKRRDTFEISERIMADGTSSKVIDMTSVERVIAQVKEKGYQSVAVCLLHAYKNPEHEVVIRKAFQSKAPEIAVSLSHEIAREWREYERTSTTVINAYVAPIVKNYLSILEKETANRGLGNSLYIMQSNGGVMTSDIAKDLPIQTLLSGPVGGAIGSITLADSVGYKNIICADLGGTSFDVSLIINGQPDITVETNLEGFPILSPMVNIHTIGAGGGSIAYVEAGGLRVGPKSAGSNPGPACYGKGGTEPTVTDANLVLGRIDENGFLGGGMKLDKEAAYLAIERIASQLGLSVTETAEGICKIANAKMADAIRTITVSKGIDPRDFVMVAYGGAGPMHALFIAELLGIDKVLVPSVAGTFSAFGMLQTDIRYDTVRHFVSPVEDVEREDIERTFREMEEETKIVLEKQQIAVEDMIFNRSVDMRYVGQEYTINVPYEIEASGENAFDPYPLMNSFHELHRTRNGQNNPSGKVEVVNARFTGYGFLEKVTTSAIGEQTGSEPKERVMKKTIWNGIEKDTPVYTTQTLHYGHQFEGPAIVEDASSTTVVPSGFVVEIDMHKNILVTRKEIG